MHCLCMFLPCSFDQLCAAVPHARLLWDVQLRSSLALGTPQARMLARRVTLANWCVHVLLVVLL